jgi:protease II
LQEVISHREDVFIEKIDVFRHHFVAWEWHGGNQRIRVQDLSDLGDNFLQINIPLIISFPEVHYVQLPDTLHAVWPGGIEGREDSDGERFNHNPKSNPTHTDTLSSQYFNSNTLRFSYCSFIQPTIVYDYDMDNRRKRIQKEVLPGSTLPLANIFPIGNHGGIHQG